MATRPAPFFVVGANRSGTTLLRLLLNAHSRLAVPDEVEYFKGSLARQSVRSWERPRLAFAEYEALVEAFLSRASEPLAPVDLAALRDRILDGPADLRRPYALAMDAWADAQSKPRWGEKTPGNAFYPDVLRAMFPGARFIHVARDPRAGVASMRRGQHWPDDVVLNALARRKYHRRGRGTLERHVPPEHRLDIRYEDLVADPDGVVRRVCAFLGEPFEPDMLAFHRDARRYMRTEAAESFNAAALRPVTDAAVDRWRTQLSPEDVGVVEWLCAAEMRAFGYRPEGGSIGGARRLEVAAKRAYWAWQTLRAPRPRHYTVLHTPFGRLRSRIDGFLGRRHPSSARGRSSAEPRVPPSPSAHPPSSGWHLGAGQQTCTVPVDSSSSSP